MLSFGLAAPVIISLPSALLLGISTGTTIGLTSLLVVVCIVGSIHMLSAPSDVRAQANVLLTEKSLATSTARLDPLKTELEIADAKLAAVTSLVEELGSIISSRRHQLLATNWRAMRGIEFERFLEAVFSELGYKVETTPTSGDQGVDLVVSDGKIRIAIQIKGYEHSVGNDAVQQACAGVRFHRCHQAAVITNSHFTASAKALAKANQCRLIDQQQIEPLIAGELDDWRPTWSRIGA